MLGDFLHNIFLTWLVFFAWLSFRAFFLWESLYIFYICFFTSSQEMTIEEDERDNLQIERWFWKSQICFVENEKNDHFKQNEREREKRERSDQTDPGIEQKAK